MMMVYIISWAMTSSPSKTQQILVSLINFLALSAGREKVQQPDSAVSTDSVPNQVPLLLLPGAGIVHASSQERAPPQNKKIWHPVRNNGYDSQDFAIWSFDCATKDLHPEHAGSAAKQEQREYSYFHHPHPVSFMAIRLLHLWSLPMAVQSNNKTIQMGITKNEAIKTKFEYLSILSWYLDCWTGLIRNILIYFNLVR